MTASAEHKVPTNGRAITLAMVATIASTTVAAHVCVPGGQAISVPMTLGGVYINFLTGATGTSPVPDWHFNAYGESGFGLSFYTPSTVSVVMSESAVKAMFAGEYVSSTSSFGSGNFFGSAMQSWHASVDRYVGFRFKIGEGTHYGSVRIQAAAPLGFPAYIGEFCYEATPDTAHPTGWVPVTLQQFSIQ